MDELTGKSFEAQLMCITEGFRGLVAATTEGGIAKQGWLIVDGDGKSAVTFAFTYLGLAEGRVLYAIKGGTDAAGYQGAPLDVSRNGYIGFYPSVDEAAAWRLEITRKDSEGKPLRCLLRDATGKRAGIQSKTLRSGSRADGYSAYGQRVDYLNVQDGVIAEFEIRYQG